MIDNALGKSLFMNNLCDFVVWWLVIFPRTENAMKILQPFLLTLCLAASLPFIPLFSPPRFRYRQTRFSSRRVRKRVIFKHGDVNVVQGNVAKRRRRYLQVTLCRRWLPVNQLRLNDDSSFQDIFTTLVDMQWRNYRVELLAFSN
jgi:hypothetical protein